MSDIPNQPRRPRHTAVQPAPSVPTARRPAIGSIWKRLLSHWIICWGFFPKTQAVNAAFGQYLAQQGKTQGFKCEMQTLACASGSDTRPSQVLFHDEVFQGMSGKWSLKRQLRERQTHPCRPARPTLPYGHLSVTHLAPGKALPPIPEVVRVNKGSKNIGLVVQSLGFYRIKNKYIQKKTKRTRRKLNQYILILQKCINI